MLTVWRLITARLVETAFSGEGARLYGGRWNRKGVPLVYTAGSQSLAMLEMLVQDEPLRARYVMIPATIPKGLKIERVSLAACRTYQLGQAAKSKTGRISTKYHFKQPQEQREHARFFAVRATEWRFRPHSGGRFCIRSLSHSKSDKLLGDLPAGWRDRAAREQLQAIGTDWAKRTASAVLAVPSAVIPAETHYLLNPLHPGFTRIEIGDPQEFITDLRLIRK